ncbi:NAD(P)H-dependent oxidoreductase [Marinomonas sp. SM2066]|uniref:NAD(P)H-dependent oxidoreductase n=1 Tax=Marinomonas colpomeniae TaxID=2774408 RepID=A0ABR8NYK2_9GAMM|nr:NAD(P)H-dependent oxidoreductase [Marinomonas colpomeniae]
MTRNHVNHFRLLALSGSLRAASFNTAALHALAQLAPDNVNVLISGLGDIPLFNPDLENSAPSSVIALKEKLRACDGLIIASPEYAHGMTGVLKNALDWLVSGDEFVDKPIMLINTSPRATHAQASLKEVLITMSGKLIENAQVTIPLLGSQLDCQGIVAHVDISQQLKTSLNELCEAITQLK